jgi:hypothetical protein
VYVAWACVCDDSRCLCLYVHENQLTKTLEIRARKIKCSVIVFLRHYRLSFSSTPRSIIETNSFHMEIFCTWKCSPFANGSHLFNHTHFRVYTLDTFIIPIPSSRWVLRAWEREREFKCRDEWIGSNGINYASINISWKKKEKSNHENENAIDESREVH